MMMLWFSSLIILALVLISVAFYTLVERKILGYSHERFGPNKVGYYGLVQPFSDAVKLFTKENLLKFKSLSYYLYFMSPIWGISLSMYMWMLVYLWGSQSRFNLGLIVFFILSSFAVYFLLMSGWSSMSKYSAIGSYRSSSQAISYEVILVMVVLLMCFLFCSYDLLIFEKSGDMLFLILTMPLVIVWVLSCFAETNRSPFDFSEGESELVSGFNTEYYGGGFSLIFIGEYSSILFLSFLTGMVFCSEGIFIFMFILLVSFSFLWVRCSFPRLRYDKLMMMAWKGLLCYVLGCFNMFLYFLW